MFRVRYMVGGTTEKETLVGVSSAYAARCAVSARPDFKGGVILSCEAQKDATAGDSVLEAFAEEFSAFQVTNRSLIADIESATQDRRDEVDEVLDDYAAELKSRLGAKAANCARDDEDAQDSAIEGAEAWVADNVSNGSLASRIAAVLWLEESPDRAKEVLLIGDANTSALANVA